MFQLKSKSSLLENSLLLRKSQTFVLFRPSTDWTRPTHMMEGNLPYSKSTDTSLFPNWCLTEISRIMFGRIFMTLTSWHVKLIITQSKRNQKGLILWLEFHPIGKLRTVDHAPEFIPHGGTGWGWSCWHNLLRIEAEWLWQLEKVLRERRQVLVVGGWSGVPGSDMGPEKGARCRWPPPQGPCTSKYGSNWHSQDFFLVSHLCDS